MDKAQLEAQLKALTEDWTGLNAGVVQRQQETEQLHNRLAVLKEEILRNQGALAYNQLLNQRITEQLKRLDSPVNPPSP